MKPNLSRVLMLALRALIGLVVLLLIVVPLLSSLIVKTGQMPMAFFKFLSYVETVQAYLMRGLGFVWIFFLGSCFASFLNVVAWRVPRGRGINGSSKCPYCDVKLSFHDNVPIVGWIRNAGCCSTCRHPISPRYLIVEILLGCIFLVVCSVEILAGGLNLPLREIERLRGFEHLIFAPKWDLIQLAVYHLVLICFLFTFALIRSEKLKIPVSIFVAGLVIGIGLPLIWPAMLLVSWQIGAESLFDLERFSQNQMLTIAMGLMGGLGCGLLVYGTQDTGETPDESSPSVIQRRFIDDGLAGLVLIGLYLGWQSAFSVSFILMVVMLLSCLFEKSRLASAANSAILNLSTMLLIATLVHLMVWRLVTWLRFWPGPSANGSIMAIWICVLLGMGTLLRITAIRNRSRQNTIRIRR